MTLYKGTTPIAGIGKFQTNAGWNIFDCKLSDHILSDIQWLRSDTFSWQSGSVYTTAYNHLVSDISGITSETETIGSYTVTFYRATDGHKICLADQETTVNNIFSSTGIAWYYILDTTNTRFKLPRMKYKYWKNQTTLPVKGNGNSMMITNGTSTVCLNSKYDSGNQLTCNSSDTTITTLGATLTGSGNAFTEYRALGLSTDSTKSGIVADVSDSIIETGFYLYFYVGEYTQTAIEQTAGLNSELFNGKLDITSAQAQAPYLKTTYVNGTSGYNIWSDGYCEQWGRMVSASSQTITLTKTMSNIDYIVLTQDFSTTSTDTAGVGESTLVSNLTTTTFRCSTVSGRLNHWLVKGYLAEGQY